MFNKKVAAAGHDLMEPDLEAAGAYFVYLIKQTEAEDVSSKVKIYKKAAAHFLEKTAGHHEIRFAQLAGYLTAIRAKANDLVTQFYLKQSFLGVALYFVNKHNLKVVDFEGLVDLRRKQFFSSVNSTALLKIIGPSVDRRQSEFSFFAPPTFVEKENEILLFPLLPWLASIKPSSIKIIKN